jgi:hypothetical protein
MKPIIEPVDKELLIKEIEALEKVRGTGHGDNEIYIFRASTSPNLMREVGRLREEAFRSGGGGTGEELDIDENDLSEDGYEQLISWDPRTHDILGGYRFIVCRSKDAKHLSTEHYFEFSDEFRNNYLPCTIELGRAFVKAAQGREAIKSIYTLDNLWDGIGALIVRNPDIKYLIGKVTLYDSYDVEARNLLLYFLDLYFGDKQRLLKGRNPLESNIDTEKLKPLFVGNNYDEDYKVLRNAIREYGEVIPPMMNAYMNLSPDMRVFETIHNPELGNVYETGIMVTIGSIYPDKYDRYTKW